MYLSVRLTMKKIRLPMRKKLIWWLTSDPLWKECIRVEIEDVILKNCYAMFVCGDGVTDGMQVQITKAKVLNIPIYRVVEGKKGVIITMYVEQEKKYV